MDKHINESIEWSRVPLEDLEKTLSCVLLSAILSIIDRRKHNI